MEIRRILLSALLCLASAGILDAQIVLTGSSDSGNMRWSQVETPHYNIIYPRGLDSLARVYGNALERAYEPVSVSSGFHPGQMFRKKTPVVLNSYYAYSNASVMVAPRRIQFYTVPDAYNPTPESWEKGTAMHESRHASQLQFPYNRLFKPFRYLTGDMVPAALSMVYPSLHLLEGDAVVTETAYSDAGRGRSGEFLAYYRAAFDQGDLRDWHSWRWGSYRHYAPDHYALGYITIAGTRVFYDDPLFMKEYLQGVIDHPFRLFHMQKHIRDVSGMKFKDAFSDIQSRFQAEWAEDAATKTFTPATPLLPTPSWYLEYEEAIPAGDGVTFKRFGLREPVALWNLRSDGKLKKRYSFSANASGIIDDGKNIYWSELIGDVRWPLKATSQIRYMDIDKGRPRSITTKGRFYNPAPEEDLSNSLLAVEYPYEGGTRVVRVSIAGKDCVSIVCKAPDGMQFCEVAKVNGKIYATAITDEGFGIYDVTDGTPVIVMGPGKAAIRDVSVNGDDITFTSDRSGVPEIYSFNTKDRTLYQHTTTRYGSQKPSWIGDTLYFSAISKDGILPYKTTSYSRTPVEFSDVHVHKVAEELSRQERELGGIPVDETPTTFSDVKPYSKIGHLLRFHSWAPVYFDPDDLAEASFDEIANEAAIGATALFQNDLESMYGSAGYAFYPKGDGAIGKNAGYLKFTYTGFYPIITARIDVGGRKAYQYFRRDYNAEGMSLTSVGASYLDQPSVAAVLQMYIPFKFSSGGWYRGVVPNVKYTISNDRYSKQVPQLSLSESMRGSSVPLFTGVEPGDNVFMQTLEASLRGYITRPVASSQTYPRWGAGLEAGYRARVSLTEFYTSAMYAYFYGYAPGIVPQQGLKVTATYQHLFDFDGAARENYIRLYPRGFYGTGVDGFISAYSPDHLKLTADYSIPVYFGDISLLSPFIYIKNFELRPHFDYTLLSFGEGFGQGRLYSVGGEFLIHCGNFLWIPLDTEIGLTFSYNGGASYEMIGNLGYNLNRTYVGAIFSVSL